MKTYYGHIAALRGIDLEVEEGEIVTLIGANGAGKSTLMMTIFGNPRTREDASPSPAATSAGCRRTDRTAEDCAGAGRRRIFVRMTVLENLQMGAAVSGSTHFHSDLERVFALFPRLKSASNSAAARSPAASSRCWRSHAH